MPLPHFLFLIAAVILIATLTLWLSFAAEIPFVALSLIALSGAVFVHLAQRDRHDHDA